MSTVEGMADPPFGFSAGDDPERDKRKKDPDSGGPAAGDPLGLGGGSDFDMSQLGQIFSRLGEMFSGAGNVMPDGTKSGPVNYDLARQLASSSIGSSSTTSTTACRRSTLPTTISSCCSTSSSTWRRRKASSSGFATR